MADKHDLGLLLNKKARFLTGFFIALHTNNRRHYPVAGSGIRNRHKQAIAVTDKSPLVI